MATQTEQAAPSYNFDEEDAGHRTAGAMTPQQGDPGAMTPMMGGITPQLSYYGEDPAATTPAGGTIQHSILSPRALSISSFH